MCEPRTPDSTLREGVPARPIRLADGAEWGLSRPTVRLSPRVSKGLDGLGRPVQHVTVGFDFGYPLGVQRLIDRVRTASERGTVREQYDAFITLAACLIRRTHAISLSEACDLLAVPLEELPRLVREVMAVVSEAGTPPDATPVEVPTVE